MGLIRPFRACLPAPELAASVVTPPLGGLTIREWQRLEHGNPHSFIHVIRGEVDTEEGGPAAGGPGPSGRARLDAMLDEGVLRRRPGPAYYVYAIESGEHEAAGIVAEVHVDGYEDGRVRRHEHTRAATEQLLVDHLRRVGAHGDPVALTYGADPDIERRVAAVRRRPPHLDFTTADGTHQQVWIVERPDEIAALQRRLDTTGPLYITDGHHRFAAAVRYAAQRRAADPGHTGQEDYDYVLAALLPDTELTLLEFNRCVGGGPDDVVAAVAARVSITALEPGALVQPPQRGTVTMITRGGAYHLRFPDHAVPDDVYGALDTVLLQELVLEPVFGITDPRSDPRLRYVAGGRAPVPEEHDCAVCFVLHPTAIEDVMHLADQGRVMPPKSTWFEPKVWGGLFVSVLEP